MSLEQSATDRRPSDELLALIKSAASTLMNFGELWDTIKTKGKNEGFKEIELMDMMRPLLKPKLTRDQIRYLFHREQEQERSRENRRKIPLNVAKKDIEQSYVETWKPDTELEDEPDYDPDLKRQMDAADRGPVTVIHDKIVIQNDDDAQMEAIAQKFEPSKPIVAHKGEEVNPMDIHVLRDRIALFDLDKCAELIIRNLRPMKSEGWKIIELTARRIT